MRRLPAVAALALLAVVLGLAVAGATAPVAASAQDATAGQDDAGNGTAEPDHVQQRDAFLDGDMVVAPCAAEPPEHDGPLFGPRDDAGATDSGNDTDPATGTDDGAATANGTATENETTTENGTTTENETTTENDTASGDGTDGSSPDGVGPAANESEVLTGEGAGVVGQVDGVWYDQPLALDHSGTLTDRELRALVARTAARVEALRCLDLDGPPEIEVVTRTTMANRQRDALTGRSTAGDRFDDARLEATLLVGTTVDPTDARARTRGETVRAAYHPAREAITILGRTTQEGIVEAGDLDEATIAHELVHALQDDVFGLESYDAQRTDEAMAQSALIEGDALLVEDLYEDRCSSDGWTDRCLSASPPDSDTDAHTALHLLAFQPYNDGPGVLERRFEAEGWRSVDELYDDPPTSSFEVLYPWAFEVDDDAFVPIPTSVAPGWERIRPPDGPANDEVGPGAIAAALMAPTFESGSDAIYSPESLRQTGTRTSLDRHQVYDYRVDVARAWRADRLIAYENDDGDVASIWRSEWESAEDAERFESRYLELLDVRGASPDRRLDGVYHFSDRGSWRGAVFVQSEGNHVSVVHAPDIPALRALHPDVPRESAGGAVRDDGGAEHFDGEGLTRAGAFVALLAVLAFATAVVRRATGR